MVALLIAVFVVLTASALCSGSEAALFSVSMVQARAQAASGSAGGRAVLEIRENMQRPIAAIVILNNVANIVGSIVVGGLAQVALGSRWLGLFSGLLTFAVIVFSEIIPKTLGERHAVRLAPWVARPVLLVTRMLIPIIWLVERVTRPIVGEGGATLTVTEPEIRLLARLAAKQGAIDQEESELITRAFRLDDSTAREIMTPRVAMTWLRGTQTLDEVRETVIASQHSRILVMGATRDDVVGVVLKSALLAAMLKGDGERVVSELVTPVPTASEGETADKLLLRFRELHQHLFVVQDEFGGVSGVVTLEDVLELLTGEIVDETDQVEDMRAAARALRSL
ncbi:MAG: HlyC/CorC family transporter [Myxococcales bacterium]|nr:HlyC/CorC family transporter [Myxococcales bacterium]MCB9754580.1 HlyC/CorC family transporter [Myxococcales bacterium]